MKNLLLIKIMVVVILLVTVIQARSTPPPPPPPWKSGATTVTTTRDWNEHKTELVVTLWIEGEGAMGNEYGPWNDLTNVITNLVIEEGVTHIGNSAFSGLYRLKSVSIPNSLVSIGKWAFDSCDSLMSINVAADNAHYTSVDGVLFNKEKNVLIRFPSGKQGVYTVPNSVISIENRAFIYTRLKSIVIPESVIDIRWDAFDKLEPVKIAADNANYIIENGVLFNKDKTILLRYPLGKQDTAYVVPQSVTTIGDHAFSLANLFARPRDVQAKNLKSIKLPHGIVSIGAEAFSHARLTSINIPNSVTSIEDGAFKNSRLTSVTVPGSVKSIGKNAFANCLSLASIEIMEGVVSIGNEAFMFTALQSIIIPKSVVSMGDDAFGYTILKSIKIPKNVASIGKMVFNSKELRSIDVVADNAHYISEDGILFNKDKTILVRYPPRKQGSVYKIPDGVISIDKGAFTFGDSLLSIIIPNSVISIGARAFAECHSLASVIIPNSVTDIGDYAFWDTRNLTFIAIPSGLTSIEDMMFAHSGLKSITIPNSVTSIGKYAFYNSRLESIIIPNNVSSIKFSTFGSSDLNSVTIPSGVVSIESLAFFYTLLTSVISLNPTPPQLGDDVFLSDRIISDSICLYVPKGSIAAYSAAEGWKNFKCIKENTQSYSRNSNMWIVLSIMTVIMIFIAILAVIKKTCKSFNRIG